MPDEAAKVSGALAAARLNYARDSRFCAQGHAGPGAGTDPRAADLVEAVCQYQRAIAASSASCDAPFIGETSL